MAHCKRFPLKEALKLCDHNKVLSVWRRELAGVFCTYQKRNLYKEGIQEIKEQPMGKWIKRFVLERKIQPLRRFRHEYNYCQAQMAQVHSSTSSK